MTVTIEDIAREIEPEAWKRHDVAPVRDNGKRQMTNGDIWSIEISIEAAERVGKMLKTRGIENEADTN